MSHHFESIGVSNRVCFRDTIARCLFTKRANLPLAGTTVRLVIVFVVAAANASAPPAAVATLL